jgi:hypothetical protein
MMVVLWPQRRRGLMDLAGMFEWVRGICVNIYMKHIFR